jgi:hypothetical protein
MKPSEPSHDLLIRLLTDWAWPVVALIVFANLRGELKRLLRRIESSLSRISLPGGIAIDLQNIEQVTVNKKMKLLSVTPIAEETAKDLRTLEVAKFSAESRTTFHEAPRLASRRPWSDIPFRKLGCIQGDGNYTRRIWVSHISYSKRERVSPEVQRVSPERLCNQFLITSRYRRRERGCVAALNFPPASDLGLGPSRCAADLTALDYHQALIIRRHNTITGVAPSPAQMPAQHQLHSKGIHESHEADISAYY